MTYVYTNTDNGEIPKDIESFKNWIQDVKISEVFTLMVEMDLRGWDEHYKVAKKQYYEITG